MGCCCGAPALLQDSCGCGFSTGTDVDKGAKIDFLKLWPPAKCTGTGRCPSRSGTPSQSQPGAPLRDAEATALPLVPRSGPVDLARSTALTRHTLTTPFGSVLQAAPEFLRLQYRDLTPEDYDLLCRLDQGVSRRGTAPLGLVARLPCTSAGDTGTTDCQVCLCELQPLTRVARLPCRHAFHPDCISRWLTQCSGKCPLCFASVHQAKDNIDTAAATSEAR
mmetsp:Transcript_60783/g.131843  ORF Transcript_60783/g.131843 Transcript_60783/m.131843 type:complete len:221 (-) Transcript_60783:95-757(-)|eukprot:CAMPEP_0170607408 /NCGR_PEP_ID=MMETSP0224-20130122/21037_1 /TAXON_ID=285029 /ORGANISM="Togula jolla, Strain CCCM 725" /LENGTH=220 /DNA_ID=CAMNT_0010932569 /DNA_START=94 /DNA_END=756 /DNA_ORIENTATION=+